MTAIQPLDVLKEATSHIDFISGLIGPKKIFLGHYKRKGCFKWVFKYSLRHKIISNDL